MDNQNFKQFLSQHGSRHHLEESLITLVKTLTTACIGINQKVRQGALSGILGEAGTGNIQGEAQKKLDVIANDLLIDALKKDPSVAGLASEEEENFVAANADGEYLVLFDPLDGSSNIDVNISIGTIFSILSHPSGSPLNTESFLQKGAQQVAAGYVLYGPQTQLVLSFGHGVYCFTLDLNNEFILTKERLNVAPTTQEFAINMSNQRHWQAPVQEYVSELLEGTEGARSKNYNMRWVASMVAEVHRILMRGGVFMYPRDSREPEKAGKLRLMYEANPMSFLIEQAGGSSSNGVQNILEIQPQELHQRVAVFLGCTEEVEYLNQKHHQ